MQSDRAPGFSILRAYAIVLAGLSPAIPASFGVLEKSGVLASLSRKRSRVQIPYAPLADVAEWKKAPLF